jgi:glucan phosphoethanolaminetransferase (alkaline phosphatase superfamily)
VETIKLSVLLSIIGGITVLTNIIVQVLKKITWDKVPTNLVALFVAMVLTLTGGAAYAQTQGIAVTWYMVAAAIVVGFMVAYAAMFGFDKLQEILKGWQ